MKRSQVSQPQQTPPIKIRVRNRWPKADKKKFSHLWDELEDEFSLEDRRPIAQNHQSTP